MTNTDLAALSDAATKGEWQTEPLDQGTQIWSADRYIGVARDYHGDDAAFIVALVNAYRSGDLVLIEREGMRERVVEAVWNCSFHPDDVASGEAQRRIAEWPADYAKARKQADAAIAAILGEG